LREEKIEKSFRGVKGQRIQKNFKNRLCGVVGKFLIQHTKVRVL